jgi:Na+/melibiose symporter-like transporter
MAVKYKYGKRPMIVWYGKIFYGAGNLGIAFITQTLTGFILFFGTVVCRVPAFVMGIAFSVGLIWDAVTDPVAGYLTDNTKSRLFGKRHGYIILSTFLIAVTNVILWSVPVESSVVLKFFWFFISIMLLQTVNTLFNTPYGALGVDLAGDYHEQTVLQTYKSVFFLIGTIAPTVIMALLQGSSPYADGRNDPSTYLNMAYISSIAMLVCGFICFMGTYSHVPRLNKKAQLSVAPSGKKSIKSVLKDFFAVIKNKNYSSVIFGYSLSMMASAFLTGVGIYMFTYPFAFPPMEMYALIGALFVATILSQPLWALAAKRFDKKPSLLAGVCITVVGVLGVLAVFLSLDSIQGTEARFTTLLGPLVVAGVGVGSLYPLPFSIMADAIAYDTVNSGEDKTATFTGFMSFAVKIAQAATLLIIGVMLEFIGFKVPDDPNIAYVPSRLTMDGLGWLFCVGSVLAMAGSAVLFSRYKLKSADIPNHETVKTPMFEVDRLFSVLEEKEKTGRKKPDKKGKRNAESGRNSGNKRD